MSRWLPMGGESVTLPPEVQDSLGCRVDRHVFLEYPYAFVPSRSVKMLSEQPVSPFGAFRETIQTYEADHFLVAYYPTANFPSDDFLIFLTEDARDRVLRRNGEITRDIWREVRRGVEKWSECRDVCWESEPGLNTRALFQVEISLPRRRRKVEKNAPSRELDECVELVPEVKPLSEFLIIKFC